MDLILMNSQADGRVPTLPSNYLSTLSSELLRALSSSLSKIFKLSDELTQQLEEFGKVLPENQLVSDSFSPSLEEVVGALKLGQQLLRNAALSYTDIAFTLKTAKYSTVYSLLPLSIPTSLMQPWVVQYLNELSDAKVVTHENNVWDFSCSAKQIWPDLTASVDNPLVVITNENLLHYIVSNVKHSSSLKLPWTIATGLNTRDLHTRCSEVNIQCYFTHEGLTFKIFQSVDSLASAIKDGYLNPAVKDAIDESDFYDSLIKLTGVIRNLELFKCSSQYTLVLESLKNSFEETRWIA